MAYFRGYCEDSQARLPPVNLQDEDYRRLKEAVNASVLIKTDIFQNTTPTEMKK